MEYTTFVCGIANLEDYLNQLGDKGWRFVGMTENDKNVKNYTVVMERERRK